MFDRNGVLTYKIKPLLLSNLVCVDCYNSELDETSLNELLATYKINKDVIYYCSLIRMEPTDKNVLRKCKVDVKVWTAITSKKHPLCSLSKGSEEFVTYVFAGTVKSCGHGFLNYNLNERVCGMITSEQIQKRDTSSSLLPNELEIEEAFLVSIPPEVNPADCVASFIPALKCYTPLRTFVNHKANETALISCHNDLNLLCITLQLCQYWNFKSIVVASDDNEERVLKSLSNNYTKIIRFMGNNSSSKVVDEIMDYTHGIGASIVFDLGFDDSLQNTFNLSDFIVCLSPFGHFITDRINCQLSESQSNMLHLKCANIYYTFPEIWVLSPLHLGKYQQMVKTIMERLKDKTIKYFFTAFISFRPKIDETVELKLPASKNFNLKSNTKTCIVYKNS